MISLLTMERNRFELEKESKRDSSSHFDCWLTSAQYHPGKKLQINAQKEFASRRVDELADDKYQRFPN